MPLRRGAHAILGVWKWNVYCRRYLYEMPLLEQTSTRALHSPRMEPDELAACRFNSRGLGFGLQVEDLAGFGVLLVS